MGSPRDCARLPATIADRASALATSVPIPARKTTSRRLQPSDFWLEW